MIIGGSTDTKSIKIPADKTIVFFENGSFDSTEFIDYLNTFDSLVIEVNDMYHDIEKLCCKLSEQKKNLKKEKLEVCFSGNKCFIKYFEKHKVPFSIVFSAQSYVTSIEEHAFSYLLSLEKVSISSSVTSIGKDSFRNCSSLVQVTIPSSVTSIGDYAFNECSLLAQITIPSSVTSIGEQAFFQCLRLAQISISSSLSSIGDNIFFFL